MQADQCVYFVTNILVPYNDRIDNNCKPGKNIYDSFDCIDVWKKLFQGKKSLKNDLLHLNESL